MSFRFISSISIVAGMFALAPLFAEPTPPVAKERALSDEEVRSQLEGNESTQWERAVASRAVLLRDLDRAKVKAAGNGSSGIEMKGFETETPEARKAKAEKLVLDLTAKISDVEKSLGIMREIAAARVKAASYTVPCPVKKLPEAIATTAGEIRAAAVAKGYKSLALAGVFVPLGGAVTSVSDSGLTDALRAALVAGGATPGVEPCPSFAGATLKVASDKKTAIVLAEALPLGSFGGALWSVRLVDAATFRVVAASSTFIPSSTGVEAAKKDPYNRDKQPASYEISVQDRRNFVARLGASINLSFGVDGDGVDATMLRAALATRPNPDLNDFAFLASVLGGPKTDSVSKALWVIQPGASAGKFMLGARLVGDRSSSVAPMGEVVFRPAVAKPAAQ